MAENNHNVENNEGELLHRVCAVPPHIKWLPDVDVHEVTDNRKNFVLDKKFKWANGTQIRYYFINDSFFDKKDKNVVRESFQEWANLGISLSFKEVTTRRDADVAIEFSRDQSAWSYVGTDCRSHKSGATMHFGWSLSDDPYGRTTALHEIGHAIGLHHEHQNPNSGIVWDEQAVIRYFARQGWDEPTTRHNILDHIPTSSVFASKWDPISVMEYHFAAGLILKPVEYKGGIKTNYVLSPTDIKWIREYYPLNGAPVPLGSAPLDLKLKQGEEGTFTYVPPNSGIHRIGILGDYDALIVVSDKEGKHIAASDDSLTDRHAEVFAQLNGGEEYLIRVRLYGTDTPGASSVLFARFLPSD